MGKPNGFMNIGRENAPKRPVAERVKDFSEIEQRMDEKTLCDQGARCMDCGIPFCNNMGCPLGNMIPEWNDMVYHGRWRQALDLLHSTNNFPEFTGRLCPALCEAACTLGANSDPVSVRQVELHIVEKGWAEGYITPKPAAVRLNKRVAVVGSGPAGLVVAQQLSRKGYDVVVYEADAKPGGILRYGIPDFKLEKHIIDRRLEQMRAEGVVFETNVRVGEDVSVKYLRRTYDAVVFSGGAKVARDLKAPGRELKGIHFAMDYLIQQNLMIAGEEIVGDVIMAQGKNVLVIGGGDTGADCVGTAVRQRAKSVTQIEIMPRPPEKRADSTPWPLWPYMLRTGSSHDEGCDRRWSLNTIDFQGTDGCVTKWHGEEVKMVKDTTGRMKFESVANSEQFINAELVLLALGFMNEGNGAILSKFGVKLAPNSLPELDANLMTSEEGLFVAGDLATGQSLVVRSMAHARSVAEGVHSWLSAK